jgi:hypothetical protein
MRSTGKSSRILATLLFAFFSIFELIHDLVVRAVWPGYTLGANDVVFLLVPLWFAAIAGLWLRRKQSVFWVLTGFLAALTHTLVIRMGESAWGYPFFACTIALGPLAWYAMKPELREMRRHGGRVEISPETTTTRRAA